MIVEAIDCIPSLSVIIAIRSQRIKKKEKTNKTSGFKVEFGFLFVI